MKVIVGLVFLWSVVGCTGGKKEAAENSARSLSPAELSYLKQQNPDSPVAIVIIKDGEIVRKTVAATEVLGLERETLNNHSDSVFGLDFPVSFEDIQNDFSGKTEFNLDDWRKEAPLADGRGVKIAVVDDGVGLGRAGLETNTLDQPKIIQFFNLNPRWNLKTTVTALPLKFEFSACGMVRESQQALKLCHDFGKTLSDSGKLSAELHAEGASYRLVLSNGVTLQPLSENLLSRVSVGDGTYWGFDVYKEGDSILLSIKIPERGLSETALNSGSHGEGVAGISGGHNLGNQKLDGVAPGAQLIDVHFTDPTNGLPFTIGGVLEALVYAGKTSDIVNLSYSLYFDNPVAQVSMGRLLSVALKSINAIYFFSAGNNGPGIGSMNRSLIYPIGSIPVAAYLSGRLAQTTFGSAEPFPAVAPYSSVGPGVDGGGGALLLSPLAGMTTSTSDGGYQAFSGTSSATPALAGFSALLLSRIRLENLPWDRKIFREALIRSATPLKGVAFIEQGYGIPSLTKAFSIYQDLLANQSHPILSVVGQQVTDAGIKLAGIYARNSEELLSQYSFKIELTFPEGTTEEQKGNATEVVTIDKTGDFINIPDRLLVGRAGASFQITLSNEKFTVPGAYIGEVHVRLLTTGQAVTLPVTVIVPDKEFGSFRKISVPKGGMTRLFFEVKKSDTSLLMQVESPKGFCGRVGVYNPSGVRSEGDGVQSVTLTSKLFEQRHPLGQPGIYELVIEGRQSHRVCPSDQVLNLRTAIVGGAFSLINQNDTEMLWSMDASIEGDDVARSAYRLYLEDPVEVKDLPLSVVGGDKSTIKSVVPTTTEKGQNARLFYREKSSYAKIVRFADWNLKAVSAVDSKDLTLDPVEGGYAAELGELSVATDFVWIRFEQGLNAEDLPTTLGTAQLWFQHKEEANDEISLGWQDPTVSGIVRTDAPRGPYREWGCRIRPAGFQTVSASCGRVGR